MLQNGVVLLSIMGRRSTFLGTITVPQIVNCCIPGRCCYLDLYMRRIDIKMYIVRVYRILSPNTHQLHDDYQFLYFKAVYAAMIDTESDDIYSNSFFLSTCMMGIILSASIYVVNVINFERPPIRFRKGSSQSESGEQCAKKGCLLRI